MYYIYKSCIGDPIVTENSLTNEELVCNVCGKKAELIGIANNKYEVANIINNSDFIFSHTSKNELESMFLGLKYSPKCGIIIE